MNTINALKVENTIDELKTHLNGRKTPIRSLNPREVAAGSLWLALSSTLAI